jgi:DHA2 family multidrug resistance protein
MHGHPDAGDAMHEAIIAIGQSIRSHAAIMGYADCFGLIGAMLSLAVLSVVLLKKGARSAGGAH